MTRVDFDNTLYSKEAIEQAIAAYEGYAAITLTETATHIKCLIDKCTYDEDTTVKEFCNYVLSCVKV